MRSLLLGVLLALVASACDCKGSDPGTVDPSDVTASDLYGWWTTTDPQGAVTVFGFFSQADAPQFLPIQPEQATGDISVVYVGTRGTLGAIAQLATFQVNNGELLQTVIRDNSASPGTQLRTRILALTRQGELKLQSTQAAASGSRSFSWSATCSSSAKPHGYFDVPGMGCPALVSGATSLAVDLRGGVHAATAGGSSSSCGSGPASPSSYSHYIGSCEPLLSPLPAFRSSGMAVDTSTVHFAYLAQSSYELLYRSRPLGGRPNWTEERVAGLGNPVYEMRVLLHNGLPHILVNRTSGEVELYRRDSGAWNRVALPALMTGEPLSARMVDGTLDANGNLVLLSESYQKVYYQRASGFELIPLPKDGVAAGFGGSVLVDARGQVHVTYVYDEIGSNPDGIGGWVISGRGIYGVYDGTAWTSYELGPVAYPRIATLGDGPLRVVHGLYKGRYPPLALTEVARDGSLRSELITLDAVWTSDRGHQPGPLLPPLGGRGPGWHDRRRVGRPARLHPAARSTSSSASGPRSPSPSKGRAVAGSAPRTAPSTAPPPAPSRSPSALATSSSSSPTPRACWINTRATSPSCPCMGTSGSTCFANLQSPVRVKFRHTPVAAVYPISTANGSTAGVNGLAARDGRVAIIAVTNGDISFGGTVATIPSGEVLAVREADGRVWAVPVPMAPAALGIQSNGTISALFYADRSLSFPSGTVGSFSAPVVVLAHYANGSFQGVERLADVSSDTRLLAAAIGTDDTAGMVLSNGNGFGSLGVAEYNLFLYRRAPGDVLFRGLQAGAAAGGTAGLALANGRAAVALPNPFNTSTLSTLSIFQDGTLTGTQTVKGGVLTAIALGPDRLLSLWHPTEGNFDIGNGYVPFNAQAYFLAEHALDGRPLAATPIADLNLRAGYFALTSTASGTIYVRPSYNAGLEYGRLNDTSYAFTYGGDLLGNKATPLMSSVDGSSFWVAVRHQGTVNYEITRFGPTVPHRAAPAAAAVALSAPACGPAVRGSP